MIIRFAHNIRCVFIQVTDKNMFAGVLAKMTSSTVELRSESSRKLQNINV